MRLDRAIAVHFCHRLARMRRQAAVASVPILMYHGIETPSDGRSPYYETRTSPKVFASHMKFLRENEYVAVDLEEALQMMVLQHSGRKLVAITFDDGYRSLYTHAYPILMEYGFYATVFLVSGLVRDEHFRYNGNEYMTWAEARELRANGIRIGSHTVSHPALLGVSEATIEYEIGVSKQVIEDQIGEPVRAFSYPFAFPEQDAKFTFRLRELLHSYGYVCGVSTIIGTANSHHDFFFLPRIPVNTYDDIALLKAKLEGGYNWLHMFQYASKVLRGKRP
jgi:peptidoglycan/xylan/chitin deacetylase (PgdA/CDA1 family)